MKLTKYIAIDRDGSIYAYDEKPVRNAEEGLWYLPKGGIGENLQWMGFNLTGDIRKRSWADKPVKVVIEYKVDNVKVLDKD